MSFFLSVCLTVCPHVFLWFYLTIFLSFCLPLFLSFYHSMSSSHFDCLSFLQLVTLSISESISLLSLCLLCCLFPPFSGTSFFPSAGEKDVKMLKKIVLTSEQCVKHPSAGQNTQLFTCPSGIHLDVNCKKTTTHNFWSLHLIILIPQNFQIERRQQQYQQQRAHQRNTSAGGGEDTVAQNWEYVAL